MYETVRMQNFQVFADGDLRSLELLGEFSDQDSSLVIQLIKDSAASFFVEHDLSLNCERVGRSQRRFKAHFFL